MARIRAIAAAKWVKHAERSAVCGAAAIETARPIVAMRLTNSMGGHPP